LRKATLATALTLLLILNLAPFIPGAHALSDNNPAIAAFEYPVGDPQAAPTFSQGNANGYQITQMFNNSCDPSVGQGYYYAGQYFCGHTGVDLSDSATGGTVRAAANGIVVVAEDNSSYGEMVRIRHQLPDGGIVYSQYEHMLPDSLTVTPGQVVTIGQPIGQVGATGFVLGPHLHFEIKTVDENGPGYTFGNAALIIGYEEPITFIAAHLTAQGTASTATTGAPVTATATPMETPLPVTTTVPDSAATEAPTDTSTPLTQGAAPVPPPPGPFGLSKPLAPSGPPSPRRIEAARAGGEQRGVLDRFYRRYHDYVIVATAAGATLNVRADSGFEYPPPNSVQSGARLGYLGMTGNGWVHVALPGDVTGYVARQWVDGAMLPQLPPVITEASFKPPFVTVLDTRYPVRVGPAMREAALEPLKQGEKLTYLGTGAASPSWDEVVLPSGHVGWVLNWYLSKPAAARLVTSGPVTAQAAPSTGANTSVAVTGPAPVGMYVVTTVDGVHLRQGPRLAAPVIESLALGAKLLLRGYHVNWAAVTTDDGLEGYVSRGLISSQSDQPASAAATASATPPPNVPGDTAPQRPRRPHPHGVSTLILIR